ncbi:MAG: hypothetical protein R6U70_09215 [Bacillota bacterium]
MKTSTMNTSNTSPHRDGAITICSYLLYKSRGVTAVGHNVIHPGHPIQRRVRDMSDQHSWSDSDV